ncbi:hypothetical protein [Methylobacterium pseudosasicola]|uniref:Uncharacterized protein n=1 Tax=Methylobacterium pseudosasicola TaxID=582667 RepID=A0A1I4FY76_9HYPH|nr:hypothetical protein [Methylobacterium pseudosasicola]SFL22805.1 hypothetical protein SAMN05192568_100275 [Methylobacterium pseudosasicola]
MRALLTGGIKAILGIAALSTAAHWTLRVQRESTPASPIAAFASVPDPAATGSIEPRRPVSAPAVVPAPVMPAPTAGLDQGHLAALIAGATPAKAKVAKTATKTAAAEKVPAKR